jgi:hypothetical protein
MPSEQLFTFRTAKKRYSSSLFAQNDIKKAPLSSTFKKRRKLFPTLQTPISKLPKARQRFNEDIMKQYSSTSKSLKTSQTIKSRLKPHHTPHINPSVYSAIPIHTEVSDYFTSNPTSQSKPTEVLVVSKAEEDPEITEDGEGESEAEGEGEEDVESKNGQNRSNY